MKISVIQPDISWENKDSNLRKYDKMTSKLRGRDIIILPEMFSTGFTKEAAELSEPARGNTFEWMLGTAEKTGSAICGSYIVKVRNRYFNRWVFVTPDRKSWHYDKRHLFRMNDVESTFTRGTRRVVISFRGIRILPNICYDLRFPVWSRSRNDYDLLINSANWPEARRNVWLTLLKARAIENLCFAAGANRIGTDGNGIKYCGDSMIVDPKGEVLASAEKDETIISADLSLEELKRFRTKFPAHLDTDEFTINL